MRHAPQNNATGAPPPSPPPASSRAACSAWPGVKSDAPMKHQPRLQDNASQMLRAHRPSSPVFGGSEPPGHPENRTDCRVYSSFPQALCDIVASRAACRPSQRFCRPSACQLQRSAATWKDDPGLLLRDCRSRQILHAATQRGESREEAHRTSCDMGAL